MFLDRIDYVVIGSVMQFASVLIIFYFCWVHIKRLGHIVSGLIKETLKRDRFITKLSLKIAAFELPGKLTKVDKALKEEEHKDKPTIINGRYLYNNELQRLGCYHCGRRDPIEPQNGVFKFYNEPTKLFCSLACANKTAYADAIKQRKESTDKEGGK